MTINRGKPKYLDKNRIAWTKTERNTCTKTEMPGQKTEILGQKQKYFYKNRNDWTK
jgi:hypothetical protein